MSNISVDYDVLNQRGSPAWFSDVYANIPTAGYKGRMFISTDTFAFYRDTGTGWDLIGGPGIGTLTGSGVAGQISFFNGTQTITGNNNLFWDSTNNRLGIGTATPSAPLDIHAVGTNATFNGTGTNNASLVFQNAGASKWTIGNSYSAGSNLFVIYNNTTSASALSIDITTNAISSNGTGSYGGVISLKQGALTSAGTGFTTLASKGVGQFIIYFGDANLYGATILNTSLTDSRSYTLPNASGIFALTSDLSSYLPLAGGTMTGALNLTYTSPQIILNASTGGTNTIAFNVNSASVGNISIGASFYQFTNFTSGGWLFKNSAGNNVFTIADSGGVTLSSTLSINGGTITSAGSFSYTLPSASGTFALTSNITSAISGTTNTLAKFTSTNVIGNSGVSDDGTNLTYLSTAKATLLVKAVNNSYYGQLAFTNGSNALYGGISYNNSGQYMQFETNTSEWMRLGSSGNLLMNTTTDAGYRLDVNGTIRSQINSSKFGTASTSGASLILQSGSSGGVLKIMNAAGGDGTLFATGTSTSMNYAFNTYSVGDAMTLLNNGSLLLGVTTEDAVGGITIRPTGTTMVFNNLNTSPTIMAFLYNGSTVGTITRSTTLTSYNVTSDYRLKQDYKDFNGLNLILAIKTYDYEWKFNKSRMYGVVAHELQQIIPYAVYGEKDAMNENGTINPQGVDYSKIVPILIKAIQELNEKLVRNNIN